MKGGPRRRECECEHRRRPQGPDADPVGRAGRGGRPVLRSPRLLLEPMSWDHLDDLCALDADPEVMRYLGPPRSRAEVIERMVERLSSTDNALGLGSWTGFEVGGRGRPSAVHFVGWWCLSLEGPGLAEIGWRLHAHAWGRGLATEGARALLDHGFDTVGLERVMAETMAVNLGSRGVMRKLGMRHERTDHRVWEQPIPGWEEGVVGYEITRSEWTPAALRHEGR